MIISCIKSIDYIYFNLHAEEVISSNFLNEGGHQGVLVQSLQFETICRILMFVKENNFEKDLNIVLDFKEIKHVQSNILTKLIELRNLGYSLTFLNLSIELHNGLSLQVIENAKNQLNEKETFSVFYFFTTEEHKAYDLSLDEGKIFYNYFKNKLLNYVIKYDDLHTSTAVYLRSFVDLKKFISRENPLIYYALYRLAIKVKEKWEEELKSSPILVCQSLTSSYIVSILSNFLKLDILVFDKIGPINKLYSKLEKHNFENRKYIVVSDLVCLGTEVKITKNLIEFSGGKYLGNVSLVKVETLKREHIKLDNIDRTIAVFSINDKNNEELGYSIYTNLKPINE